MKTAIRTYRVALAMSFTIAGAADLLILLVTSVIAGRPATVPTVP